MLIFILVLVLIALVALPGFWVKHVLQKYTEPAERYRNKGSGAELARHLLDRFNLHEVAVEVTEAGDHYDPQARAVRLTEDKYSGYSLTAITVAAHEVGHAIQDAKRETLFQSRQRLVRLSMVAQRVGSLFMLGAPVIMLITRAPGIGFAFLVVAVGSMLVGTLVHLCTLPVELGIGHINGLSRVDILADCAARTCRPVEVSIY